MSSTKMVSIFFAILEAAILAAFTTGTDFNTGAESIAADAHIQFSHSNFHSQISAALPYIKSKSGLHAMSGTKTAPSYIFHTAQSSAAVDTVPASAVFSGKTPKSEVSSSSAAVYYPLTAAERDKVERVLMTSCGDFDILMGKANAQVILDRVKSGRFGKNIDEVLDAPHQFEKPYKGTVNAMVKAAVSAVFDRGERVTQSSIYYYENPYLSAISSAVWSRDKRYVVTIGHGKWIHQYWTDKD